MADVLYGDSTEIRELARMVHEDFVTEKTGNLELARWAKAVISITKNGTALASPADYTFKAPRTIVLVVPAVPADEFFVTIATDVSEAKITRANREGSAIVNDMLAHLYTTPFEQVGGQYPPTVVRATHYFAAHYLAQTAYMGEQNNISNMGEDYWKKGRELLAPISANEVPLVNADGTLVTKKAVLRSTTEGEADYFGIEDEARWGRLFAGTRVDGRQDGVASGTRQWPGGGGG